MKGKFASDEGEVSFLLKGSYSPIRFWNGKGRSQYRFMSMLISGLLFISIGRGLAVRHLFVTFVRTLIRKGLNIWKISGR